jgi:pseudouridine-5'-phosphate glycosidase
MTVVVADEVAAALADGRPVVALESTIFSPFGLPAPANAEALDRCLAAVRAGGATAAVTAVLDGRARVGLAPGEHERILTGGVKVAERDLPVAVGLGMPVGVTTVSAALALAAAVGITVFATGGIGGVHRDVQRSDDVSADLPALARHPVVTVCAGAKAFLDVARTLERLETLGVPVLGWRTHDFPMFWCSSSGLPVPHRVDEASEVAAVVRTQRALGARNGVLVAVPVPPDAAIPRAEIETAIRDALDAARNQGITGPAVTPHVLAAIGVATAGRAVPANLALAERNAVVAASIAGALATTGGRSA